MKIVIVEILKVEESVIYTLNFTAKTYLYGHNSTQKVIRETQADMHTDLQTVLEKE